MPSLNVKKFKLIMTPFAAPKDTMTLSRLVKLFKDETSPEAERIALAKLISKKINAEVKRAHNLGIEHNDISPKNILLRKNLAAEGGFDVKLIDFGLSKDQVSCYVKLDDPNEDIGNTAGFRLTSQKGESRSEVELKIVNLLKVYISGVKPQESRPDKKYCSETYEEYLGAINTIDLAPPGKANMVRYFKNNLNIVADKEKGASAVVTQANSEVIKTFKLPQGRDTARFKVKKALVEAALEQNIRKEERIWNTMHPDYPARVVITEQPEEAASKSGSSEASPSDGSSSTGTDYSAASAIDLRGTAYSPSEASSPTPSDTLSSVSATSTTVASSPTPSGSATSTSASMSPTSLGGSGSETSGPASSRTNSPTRSGSASSISASSSPSSSGTRATVFFPQEGGSGSEPSGSPATTRACSPGHTPSPPSTTADRPWGPRVNNPRARMQHREAGRARRARSTPAHGASAPAPSAPRGRDESAGYPAAPRPEPVTPHAGLRGRRVSCASQGLPSEVRPPADPGPIYPTRPIALRTSRLANRPATSGRTTALRDGSSPAADAAPAELPPEGQISAARLPTMRPATVIMGIPPDRSRRKGHRAGSRPGTPAYKPKTLYNSSRGLQGPHRIAEDEQSY